MRGDREADLRSRSPADTTETIVYAAKIANACGTQNFQEQRTRTAFLQLRAFISCTGPCVPVRWATPVC
jgi:hypothetical protein